MNGPNPVIGSGVPASWLERLRQAARSWRLLPGPGYRLKQYSDGMVLELLPRGGGSAPAGAMVTYQITALSNSDFVTAQAVITFGAPNVLSGVAVQIAKDWHLRCSLLNETIDGVLITYSQVSDNMRMASDGTNSEIEVMFPRYVVGGLICAMPVTNGTGLAGVSLMETKPDRVWARRYQQ